MVDGANGEGCLLRPLVVILSNHYLVLSCALISLENANERLCLGLRRTEINKSREQIRCTLGSYFYHCSEVDRRDSGHDTTFDRADAARLREAFGIHQPEHCTANTQPRGSMCHCRQSRLRIRCILTAFGGRLSDPTTSLLVWDVLG